MVPVLTAIHTLYMLRRRGSLYEVRSVSEIPGVARGEIHSASEVETQTTSYLQSCCSVLTNLSLIVSSLACPSSIALLVTVKGRGLRDVTSSLYNLPVLYLQPSLSVKGK